MPTENHVSSLERVLVAAGGDWHRGIGARAAAELWAEEGFTADELEAVVPTLCYDPVIAKQICERGLLMRATELIQLGTGTTTTIGHALMRGYIGFEDLRE